MDENKALKEYSKRFIYDGYELSEDELRFIRKSLGFNRYLLSLNIEELKKEIYNSLPKWLKSFLRWLS